MGNDDFKPLPSFFSSSFEDEDEQMITHLQFEQNLLFGPNPNLSQSSSSKSEQISQKIYYVENTNAKTNDITNKNMLPPEEIKCKVKNEVKEFNDILYVNHYQKKIFTSVKLGRLKKDQQNKEIKNHNKNSYDNAGRKMINSCKVSLYNFVTEITKIKLHIPTIEKQLGYSYTNMNKFMNKSIYDIFVNTSPKRLKDEIKTKRENYDFNKKQINQLLEKEKNDPKKTNKIFNSLFTLPFGKFLMLYLNDVKEIKINEETIHMTGFKTLGESFNERKNGYTQAQKNVYKKHLLEIMQNKKNTRKPRSSKKKLFN